MRISNTGDSPCGAVHVIRITMMGLLVLLAFDANIITAIRAQETIITGDNDVCGCSPSTYTFILDFSLSCPPTNITTGSGVASVSCLINPFGAPTNKLAPVVIDSVNILELDQVNNVLAEERIDGDLVDGDSFSYASIINNPEGITSIRQIPKALQLNLHGKNEDGVMLMNVFIVTFSNECGVFPVIQQGESAGWVIFNRMSEPIPWFCPTLTPWSEAPTEKPAQQPSKQPIHEPTQRQTLSPTPRPTNDRTQQPTRQPTYNPTQRITPSPTPHTNKPTRRRTPQPSRRPSFNGPPQRSSDKPTVKPTGEPTRKQMSMSMSMSMALDLEYSQLTEGELELMEEYSNN